MFPVGGGKDEMNAKEYLEQIQLLDVKIQQDLERLEEMKHSALGMRAIRYDTDKVQVSPSDKLCADTARIIDFDEYINREIDRFTDQKERVIQQIQGMSNANHVKLLFKVYVQYKTLKQAAAEMKISYSYSVELHKKALQTFETIYLT